MKKIKADDTFSQDLWRSVLQAWDAHGVQAARNVYKEITNCTASVAREAVAKLEQLLGKLLVEKFNFLDGKLRKGMINVGECMAVLTLTEEEIEEQERQQSEWQLEYYLSRAEDEVVELKKDLAHQITRMEDELKQVKKWFVRAEGISKAVPYEWRMATRAIEFDKDMTKLIAKVTTYRERLNIMQQCSKLTGIKLLPEEDVEEKDTDC